MICKKTSRTTGCALVVWLLLQGGLGYADDTEIYIGGSVSKDIKPNIFFIIDDSESMANCLGSDDRPAPGKKCPAVVKIKDENGSVIEEIPVEASTRLKVLKDVMTGLLDELNDVNVGLMTFRGTEDNINPKSDGTLMSEWRKQIIPVGDIGGLNSKQREGLKKVISNMEVCPKNRKERKWDSGQACNLTPIIPSLYEAARYLTDIKGKHSTWEMHKNHKNIPSPIQHECQPTHMVLLTDGVANWSWKHTPGDREEISGTGNYHNGVAPQKSDISEDIINEESKLSKYGPNSYQAVPNELHDEFKVLLDEKVGSNHSQFANPDARPEWAGTGADNRLCKMRGAWKWIPINKDHRDTGSNKDYLYDEYRYVGDTDCAVELVRWLNQVDQSPDNQAPKKLHGKQSVITHAVGFALSPLGVTDSQSAEEFLKEITDDLRDKEGKLIEGRGKYYKANNKEQLKDAFKDIVSKLNPVDNAAFVNPAVVKSSFSDSEAQHKDELYYSLFKPEASNRWDGNLKRYRMKLEAGGVVVDVNGKPVYDVDGLFHSDAKSFWSTEADGGEVKKGGAASRLSAPDARNIFINVDDKVYALKTQSEQITEGMLGISPSEPKAEREKERNHLLNYLRGFSEDGSTPRKTLGDLLHSQPALFSYRCQVPLVDGQCPADKDEQMALVGTNEGFVHMFDARTGIEQFAFMPNGEEFLKNVQTLRNNSNSTALFSHPYGVDNTVTIWANDANGNKKIDADEKVYAYVTLRRGGNKLYALDITSKNNPKLAWKIVGGAGGTAGFTRLGQTWSQPVKGKIKTGGSERQVLIFAGGYDESQDVPANYRKEGQKGNAIYMVDAKNGDLLWYASASPDSGAPSGANFLKLDKMQYSIPSQVRAYDFYDKDKNQKADGFLDQIFFADTGGQVWRLFIHNNNSAGTLVTGGVMADLAEALPKNSNGEVSSWKNARRFYHAPNVAWQLGVNPKLFVNIGSGYRARPASHTATTNAFYSMQVPFFENTHATVIKPESLMDVTGNFNGKEIVATIKSNPNLKGWRIDLPRLGEKILSTPLTRQGMVFFNSYVPGTSTNPCLPATGTNYTYKLMLSNGMPVRELLNDNSEAPEVRSIASVSGGIAGDITLISNGKADYAMHTPIDTDRLPRPPSEQKIYWIDLDSHDSQAGTL